jgi:hypothetical protein
MMLPSDRPLLHLLWEPINATSEERATFTAGMSAWTQAGPAAPTSWRRFSEFREPYTSHQRCPNSK